MLAIVFPGQGSQRRGMGEKLFDEVPEYASLEGEIDACLGYSVREMCIKDPARQLSETQYTQPCLYIVNALHFYKAIANGERPRFLAGHSLGEYNALHAAGAFDLLTGLRLVQKRGELMSKVKNGGMAAVVGLDASRVIQLLQENGLAALDVANYNAPLQTVISGLVGDLERAASVFTKAGAQLYMPLPVSAAFHSRYMREVAQRFEEVLKSFTFSPLHTLVVSNVTGEPYPVADPSDTVRSFLVGQITSSVQWTRSVKYMFVHGATTFKEAGPGDVLSKLVEKMRQDNLLTTTSAQVVTR